MDQLNPQQAPTPTSSPKNKMPVIAGAIVAIAVIGSVGAYLAQNGEKNETPEVPNSPSPSNQTPPVVREDEGSKNDVEVVPEADETVPAPKQAPAVIPAGANYKDGSYQADGSYQSPAGPESVHLTVTLKDGVVTDSAFTATSEAPKSVFFQGKFIANYKSLVIGKKIDEINLTVVSGSSLTPMGFNDALAKIAGEAKM